MFWDLFLHVLDNESIFSRIPIEFQCNLSSNCLIHISLLYRLLWSTIPKAAWMHWYGFWEEAYVQLVWSQRGKIISSLPTANLIKMLIVPTSIRTFVRFCSGTSPCVIMAEEVHRDEWRVKQLLVFGDVRGDRSASL